MAITLDGTNGVTTPDLTVDTNTIKVDATNNRVGIGTSSPTTALTLGTSHTATVQNGGSVSAPSYGIVSGAIGVNGTYVPAANTLGFVAGGAERGRFTANGLTFNGDTAAANALDDYEEGTWTPVWTIAPSGTTTSLAGQYTKIGRLVYLQFQASGSNFSIGSYARVQGLPFAATDDSDSGTYIIGSIVQRGHGWISIVGGTNQLYFSSTGTTSSPTHISASAVYRI